MSQQGGRLRNRFFEPGVPRGGGHRLHHRTAQQLTELFGIDPVACLFVQIAFVQCHHQRDAQFQQLGGKEQAAAEVGGVHDVDDGIGVLMLHIGAGDAFLRGEGGHGIGPRQVHRRQLRGAGIKGFFDGAFLLFHGDPRPVADPLVAAGEGVVHSGLAAVGIARQRDSHILYSSSIPGLWSGDIHCD